MLISSLPKAPDATLEKKNLKSVAISHHFFFLQLRQTFTFLQVRSYILQSTQYRKHGVAESSSRTGMKSTNGEVGSGRQREKKVQPLKMRQKTPKKLRIFKEKGKNLFYSPKSTYLQHYTLFTPLHKRKNSAHTYH